MKRKTVLGTVAVGVAALAIAGGGTFAAWNDSFTENAAVGAGVLQLDVSSTGGAGPTESFGFGNMAPGTSKIQEIYIASSDAESVPQATLTMDLLNLVDTEADGPGTVVGVGNNCTTNSEKAEEAGDCGTVGEFSADAFIQIAHKAAASPASCAGGSYGGHVQGRLSTVVAGGPITLNNDLGPGQGRCVRIELGLPDGNNTPPGIDFAGSADSTNASQGDQATFDVTFDLTQNVT